MPSRASNSTLCLAGVDLEHGWLSTFPGLQTLELSLDPEKEVLPKSWIELLDLKARTLNSLRDSKKNVFRPLGSMTTLQTLELAFNNASGELSKE